MYLEYSSKQVHCLNTDNFFSLILVEIGDLGGSFLFGFFAEKNNSSVRVRL